MVYKLHRVDNNVVKIVNHSLDKWSLWLNDCEIDSGLGGMERAKSAFNDIVEALKAADYDYEEFVQDKEDFKDEHESRYVLSRVYSNGDVESLNWSDDKKELQDLLEED